MINSSCILQFDCSRDVTLMEVFFCILSDMFILHLENNYHFPERDFLQEQFFIMKPSEETTRSFKLYPATDQAAKYVCAGKIDSRIRIG